MATIQRPTAPASASFSGESISRLAAHVRGPIVQPDDPAYERVRALYNGMIDKHPALIVQAADVADVIATVNFARDNGLLLAIRGGGHNVAGLGSCDGGVVLDLCNMQGVRVDPATRTAMVEGGATLGQVDHATHAFGLATPSGTFSTTGVAGLTLAGGFGHLIRTYGLSIDNLLGVDMVLADGRFVTANAREHSDLFWAVRGGGGNFGVVTSFLFQLQPVDLVVAGPTFWSLDRAPEILRWYREFIRQAPEALNGFFVFITVPPVPVFPAELHGQKVAGIIWCYTGPAEYADSIFAPVRALDPLLHGPQPMPFPVLQSMFDPLIPAGYQHYWRSAYFNQIDDAAIERHLGLARAMPTPLSQVHLYAINGAMQRVGQHDTAFSFRDANWVAVFAGVDPDPANAAAVRAWATSYENEMEPHSAGSFNNWSTEVGQDRIRAAFRDNLDRLRQIKATYDPDNRFRVNQNIPPA